MFKILVCEASLTFIAKELLHEYDVDIAYENQDILDFTLEQEYDLFIINYYFYNTMLELNNYNKNAKVLFIDEYYDIQHLKKSLEIADNYMIKPLVFEELQIRVQYYYKKIFNTKNTVIVYKDFFFHKHTQQLFLKNSPIKLTPNELKLVELFMLYVNKPIKKDTLFELLNSYSDGTLRVYICKLKKIGLDILYSRSNSSYYLENNPNQTNT